MLTSIVAFLVKGGVVMAPLLVCSVMALAVVLERAWFWWRASPASDAERVLSHAARAEWDAALRVGDGSRSPVARVLAAGIRHRHPAPALAMEAAAHEEQARFIALGSRADVVDPAALRDRVRADRLAGADASR